VRVPGLDQLRRDPAVLILRALGLGDFLTGVPAYRALRAAYPGAAIVLAAPGPLAPLAGLCGAVDRLLPTGELEPIRWPGPPPAVAVNLHGKGPASHRLIHATNAATQMMYASEAAPAVPGPWWDDHEHEIARWCRLVEWWGIRTDRRDLRLRVPPVTPPLSRAAIVHPGAASAARRWPAERFAAVARALADGGHTVAITGTSAERPLARSVAARAGLPVAAVLAGATGLPGLAALVADAALVVSNDTGVSHLATAYGVPSVTVFGPVSPGLWGPPEGIGPHIALWHGREWHGREWHGRERDRPGDPHGAVTDPRLLSIEVDDVLAALCSLAEV
jgi:ADP-heptose:LPS heptosyltransferase